MNIIFFNSHTFLTREISNTLCRLFGNRFINVNIPQYPNESEIQSTYEQMRAFLPGLVISVNDAGFDYHGNLSNKLISAGCLIVNWYHDYPFYEEIFFGRLMEPSKSRIDFISEESFLPEMKERGFASAFLPLATDPEFFNTKKKNEAIRDVAFVGNSSSVFMDSLLTEKRVKELEKLLSLQSEMKRRYQNDTGFDIINFLLNNKQLWQNKTDLDDRQLLFCIEWMIGYLYRRDFICCISKRYREKFTCFGDAYWKNFISQSVVSTEACYYSNLCNIYRSTKVNLNVNRIQIKTAFTQRIFDCAASGAFILTDKRKWNSRLFKTAGADCELVEFDSFQHCCDLIDYYLEHEEERFRIAEAANRKVMQYHTYDNRIAEMLEICRNNWKI